MFDATPKGRRQAVQKLINNIVSKLPVSFSPQAATETDNKKNNKKDKPKLPY